MQHPQLRKILIKLKRPNQEYFKLVRVEVPNELCSVRTSIPDKNAQTRNRTWASVRKRALQARAIPLCDLGLLFLN